jgi:hypothetical protein
MKSRRQENRKKKAGTFPKWEKPEQFGFRTGRRTLAKGLPPNRVVQPQAYIAHLTEQTNQPLRSHLEKAEGLIWINAMGPSVDLYFGPGGAGQEQPANRVLVAELVTEQACREITRVKRGTKMLDIPPGIVELDAYSQHIDELKASYAPLIRRILVDPEHRRR